MSGTFPSTPVLSTVDLESKFQNFVSVTQSGKRNVRQSGSHKWQLRGTYSSLTRAQFMPIFALNRLDPTERSLVRSLGRFCHSSFHH